MHIVVNLLTHILKNIGDKLLSWWPPVHKKRSCCRANCHFFSFILKPTFNGVRMWLGNIFNIFFPLMFELNIIIRHCKATPSIPLHNAWTSIAQRECCFKDHKLGTNTIFRWSEWADRVDVLECTWLACLCRVMGQQPGFLRDCPPKLQRWA